MALLKIYVNSTPVRVPSNTSLISAVGITNIALPRFCYHEMLNIAGNCRMCLVEVEKSPKPQASCALPVIHGIKTYTNTPYVKKSRESVLELLLVNHPLDCPICDQGGCCDLQDQAIKFGNKLSRFYIKKRSVIDKAFGPLIKTIITRCIHCTRCVRFASHVAGVDHLGTSLRGVSTEIGTYVEKIFHSEVSMSVVALCPVGSKPIQNFVFAAKD